MKKVLNLVKRKTSGGGGGASSASSMPNLSDIPPSPSGSSHQQQKRGSVVSVASSALVRAVARRSSSSGDAGASKLHLAVWNEDMDRVTKLLGKSDVHAVNAADARGRTPLHLAAEKGSAALVGLLLAKGAVVQARDGQGSTPLHRAVQGGHLETSNMLLDRGCQLDVADINGDTVLHLATRNENNDILAVLLRKGANPDLRNKKGESPLLESIRLAQVPAAQLLLRCGASVNQPGPRDVTALMLACSDARVAPALVETLLDYEADPLVVDKSGWNAIRYAQEARLTDIVNMIERFLESQSHDVGETGDSFEEDDDDDEFEPLGLPMRKADQTQQQQPGSLRMSERGFRPIAAAAVSDLSSWESDSPVSGMDIVPTNSLSQLKHSKGIADLSKFLDSDNDVEEKEPSDKKPNKDEQKLKEPQQHDVPNPIPNEPKQLQKVTQAMHEVTQPKQQVPQKLQKVPEPLPQQKLQAPPQKQPEMPEDPMSDHDDDWSIDSGPTNLLVMDNSHLPPPPTVAAKPASTSSNPTVSSSSRIAEKSEDKLGSEQQQNLPSLLANELKEKLGARLKAQNEQSLNASSPQEKTDVDDQLPPPTPSTGGVRRKWKRNSEINRSIKSNMSRETTSSESDLDEEPGSKKPIKRFSPKGKKGEDAPIAGVTSDKVSKKSDTEVKEAVVIPAAKAPEPKKLAPLPPSQSVKPKAKGDAKPPGVKNPVPAPAAAVDKAPTVKKGPAPIAVKQVPPVVKKVVPAKNEVQKDSPAIAAPKTAAVKPAAKKTEAAAAPQKEVNKSTQDPKVTASKPADAAKAPKVLTQVKKESPTKAIPKSGGVKLKDEVPAAAVSGAVKIETPVDNTVRAVKEVFFNKLSEGASKDPTPAGGMLSADIMGMDKPDLLVYVQKLHLSLDESKANSAAATGTAAKQLENLTAEHQKLKEDLFNTSASLQNTIDERKSWQEKCVRESERSGQLEQELSVASDRSERLEDDDKELREALEREKSQKSHFESMYLSSVSATSGAEKEVEREREDLRHQLELEKSKHQHELSVLTKDKEELINSVRELKSSLDKSDKMLSESNEALKTEQKNLENLKNARNQSLGDSFKKELAEEREKAIKTTEAFKVAQSEMEDAVNALKILQKKHEQKEMELADMTMEAKALRQEVQDVKAATTRKDHVNASLKDKLQLDKEKLQEDRNNLQEEKKRLQEEKEELSVSLEKKKEELKQQKLKFKEDLETAIEAAKRDKKKEKRELEEELDDTKAAMKKQTKAVDDLSEELSELKKAKERLDELAESLKKQVTSKSRSSSITADIARLEAENHRLEKEVRLSLTERDELASAAKHWEAEAKRLQEARATHERERLMEMKEGEVEEVGRQLQEAQLKIAKYEGQIQHLQVRIAQLEENLQASTKEKKAILAKLKKKEAECEDLSTNVVEVLKQELKKEQQMLEKEQEKVELLEAKKKGLERDMGKLSVELTEFKLELVGSGADKKKLKKEMADMTDQLYSLEQRLEAERRQPAKNANVAGALEEKIAAEQRKNAAAEKRIAQLMDEFEKEQLERLRAEETLQQRLAEKSAQAPIVDSLRGKVTKLQKDNLELNRKLIEVTEKQKASQLRAKRTKELAQEVRKKDKIIEDLEGRLSGVRQSEEDKHAAELKKCQLRFEIMARNEVNQKLSEINTFLEERAVEQSANERSRDEVMEKIQKDLGEKLQQSKQELTAIKSQMAETVKGIGTLQAQLKSREQELALERNLRKQLERHLNQDELKKLLICDYVKPYAYF